MVPFTPVSVLYVLTINIWLSFSFFLNAKAFPAESD